MTEPLVGRYQLVKEIGRGGFGLVEEYRDLILGNVVAIKTIAPHHIRQETKRLIREIDIMTFLYNAHPHVIDFSAMFVTRCRGGVDSQTSQPAPYPSRLNVPGSEYSGLSIDAVLRLHHQYLAEEVKQIRQGDAFSLHIVMPLMKGDLTGFMKILGSASNARPLGLTPTFLKSTTAIFAFQLFLGLDYLHCSGILHRDLKPENILVRLDTQSEYNSSVCIADMGLARDGQDGETFYVCTRYYRPPEIIMTVIKNHPGLDMWSMGCILYELCTGKTLFMMPTALDERGAWEGSRASSQLEVILNLVGTPSPADTAKYMPPGNAATYLQRSKPRPSRVAELLRKHWVLGCDEAEKMLWIDLIIRCLAFYPHQRPTAAEACCHPLFTRYDLYFGKNVVQNKTHLYVPTFSDSQTSTALMPENKGRILQLVCKAMELTTPEEPQHAHDEEGDYFEEGEEEEEEGSGYIMEPAADNKSSSSSSSTASGDNHHSSDEEYYPPHLSSMANMRTKSPEQSSSSNNKNNTNNKNNKKRRGSGAGGGSSSLSNTATAARGPVNEEEDDEDEEEMGNNMAYPSAFKISKHSHNEETGSRLSSTSTRQPRLPASSTAARQQNRGSLSRLNQSPATATTPNGGTIARADQRISIGTRDITDIRRAPSAFNGSSSGSMRPAAGQPSQGVKAGSASANPNTNVGISNISNSHSQSASGTAFFADTEVDETGRSMLVGRPQQWYGTSFFNALDPNSDSTSNFNTENNKDGTSNGSSGAPSLPSQFNLRSLQNTANGATTTTASTNRLGRTRYNSMAADAMEPNLPRNEQQQRVSSTGGNDAQQQQRQQQQGQAPELARDAAAQLLLDASLAATVTAKNAISTNNISHASVPAPVVDYGGLDEYDYFTDSNSISSRIGAIAATMPPGNRAPPRVLSGKAYGNHSTDYSTAVQGVQQLQPLTSNYFSEPNLTTLRANGASAAEPATNASSNANSVSNPMGYYSTSFMRGSGPGSDGEEAGDWGLPPLSPFPSGHFGAAGSSCAPVPIAAAGNGTAPALPAGGGANNTTTGSHSNKNLIPAATMGLTTNDSYDYASPAPAAAPGSQSFMRMLEQLTLGSAEHLPMYESVRHSGTLDADGAAVHHANMQQAHGDANNFSMYSSGQEYGGGAGGGVGVPTTGTRLVGEDPNFPVITDPLLRLQYRTIDKNDRGAQEAITAILSELSRSTHDTERSGQLRDLLSYFTSLQANLRGGGP